MPASSASCSSDSLSSLEGLRERRLVVERRARSALEGRSDAAVVLGLDPERRHPRVGLGLGGDEGRQRALGGRADRADGGRDGEAGGTTAAIAVDGDEPASRRPPRGSASSAMTAASDEAEPDEAEAGARPERHGSGPATATASVCRGDGGREAEGATPSASRAAAEPGASTAASAASTSGATSSGRRRDAGRPPGRAEERGPQPPQAARGIRARAARSTARLLPSGSPGSARSASGLPRLNCSRRAARRARGRGSGCR